MISKEVNILLPDVNESKLPNDIYKTIASTSLILFHQ